MYSKKEKIAPLNEIIDGLFLGDHVAAESKYTLNRCGITHILSLGQGLYPKFP